MPDSYTGAGMSRRQVAAVGGGITFAMAGAAGAAGGQLGGHALWAWVCLLVAVLVGGVVTGWVAWRTTDPDPVPPPDDPPSPPPSGSPRVGDVRIGGVSASDGGQVAGVNFGQMIQHRDGAGS
ncbi:hypothetical protein; putative signal peptide [Frankia alni ACN14a]|uniref:Uncharacterized protein n=1 Tax=Frankia alni (strain DSM 45986 / CECT 9034 / ACN14a) TaxID=326424 RepID=Q0RC66_FRAAA|nr:hypothetical protein; putative signal peptide [Frankia alni ACN14a]